MDRTKLIHKTLVNLAKLGIDLLNFEFSLVRECSHLPEDMDDESVVRILLDVIGRADHRLNGELFAAKRRKLCSFELEVPDADNMYTNFLTNVISVLTGEELTITDIKEDQGGAEAHKVGFQCDGTEYQYHSRYDGDWFDPGIISVVNQALGDRKSEKYILFTTDGYQNCILFYDTEEWAEKFKACIGVALQKL